MYAHLILPSFTLFDFDFLFHFHGVSSSFN